jgi:hypothetical protein
MLAKNQRTPRGVRLPASSFTTFASMLAPTEFFTQIVFGKLMLAIVEVTM